MTSRLGDFSLSVAAQYPVLYSFRRCPYAIRARLALRIAGVAVELREVILRDKPAEMLSASPKGTVPVLLLDASGGQSSMLDESIDIMRWALNQADPDGWLKQDDEVTASLIAANDGEFKYWLDRYKYPQRFTDGSAAGALEHCRRHLAALEDRLDSHRYLRGDTITLADAALFPFVRQFAFVDKARFDRESSAMLKTWLAEMLESTLFLAVMKKYPAWRAGDVPVIF